MLTCLNASGRFDIFGSLNRCGNLGLPALRAIVQPQQKLVQSIERRRCAARLGNVCQCLDQLPHRIDRLQDHIRNGAVKPQLPLARQIEDALGSVSKRPDLHEIEEAGHPLDRVEAAEYRAERIWVGPILLKLKEPEAVWQVTAIGRAEVWPLHRRAAQLGGHLRTGFEDTFYLPDGAKAASNGRLVAALVRLAREVGRDIANPAEARQIFHLRPAGAAA